MVNTNSFQTLRGTNVNTAVSADGLRGGFNAAGPLGGRAGGFAGPNGGIIGGEGPNGRRGGAIYIPGVGLAVGGRNPANGNRGGAIITADGIAVKGNVNGQAFQNSWAF